MAMIGPIIPLYLSAPAGGGTVSFSGTASGSASASSDLTQTIALAGRSDGAAGADGALDVVVSFGGTAAGGSSASGDLTVTGSGTIRFSGEAAGSATASAALTQLIALAGQADGSSTATLAWPAGTQPGGFVPDWAVKKFWKRVREEAKATVAKPKRPKRQGARIRYAEQVTEKARRIAEEIEAEAPASERVNLRPLPEILYDVLLRDIGAIEMRMSRIEARMIAEEAERRLRQDDEEVLALLLAEVF